MNEWMEWESSWLTYGLPYKHPFVEYPIVRTITSLYETSLIESGYEKMTINHWSKMWIRFGPFVPSERVIKLYNGLLFRIPVHSDPFYVLLTCMSWLYSLGLFETFRDNLICDILFRDLLGEVILLQFLRESILKNHEHSKKKIKFFFILN